MVNNVNAQKWLDEKYKTSEEKEKVTKLYINEKDLEKKLDLAEFAELEKIYISLSIVNESKIEKENWPERAKIIKVVSAQEKYHGNEKEEINLDELIGANREFDRLEIKSFSNLEKIESNEEKCQGVTKVIISNCEKLEDINGLLSKFPNLTHLDCSSNNLKKLDVSKCPKIKKIYCQNNRLTDITLPDKAENLKVLTLLNNDLLKISVKGELNDQESKEGLSVLSNFTNLEKLYLGNFTNHEEDYLKNYDKDKVSEGVYNKFTDSLDF